MNTISQPQAGILCIRNLTTDRCLLVSSSDMESDAVRQRFDLDLGMHQCPALQDDYASIGLELFMIDPIATLQADDDLQNLYRTTRHSLAEQGIQFYD